MSEDKDVIVAVSEDDSRAYIPISEYGHLANELRALQHKFNRIVRLMARIVEREQRGDPE